MREPHTIGEVMTPAPFTVGAEETLRAARSTLLLERIHHLPVVERGHPVGLLTDRDLHLACYLCNDLVSDVEVTTGDICELDPYIVEPETPLAEVSETLARRGLGAAMVVEDGELVGIFTTHDACCLLAELSRIPLFA